ncbi:MAG: pentapeptide repeat-containing protein [Bermanella sp.]
MELNPETDLYLSQHFTDIDLSYGELQDKEFEDCTFSKCDFSDAAFNKCKFIDCSFNHCNLSSLKVDHCRFLNVNFDNSKVLGIDWTKATWPSIASFAALNFKNCAISYSSFFGLALQEITIKECKAHEVDFRDGSFNQADFSDSDFSLSLFNGTSLTKVNFEDASNYDIDVFNNDIKGAIFSRFEAVRLLDCLGIDLLD